MAGMLLAEVMACAKALRKEVAWNVGEAEREQM